jgi:hypothetical protein
MKKLLLFLILSFLSVQSFAGSCPDGSEPVKSVSDDGTYFVFNCGVNTNNSISSIDEKKLGKPPFSGTSGGADFKGYGIVTPQDPSSFKSISYKGQIPRTMYDNRSSWVKLPAFLFEAKFEDGSIIEMQVNPEFKDKSMAEIEAKKYAWLIGQLPAFLRKDIHTSWIHKGVNPFGGGNYNILIHTGAALEYERYDMIEEILIHEAAHTSLDSYHANNNDWLDAQRKDNHFISDYAEEYPWREDIAESFVAYIAVTHRSDRISSELKSTILKTIPNRIKYFDNQNFNLSIYSSGGVVNTNNSISSIDEEKKLGKPPFGGTMFIDPDIVTAEDPSSFKSISYKGTGYREMYDFRSSWVNLQAFLFEAKFEDGSIIEMQVNPEFKDKSIAEVEAKKYAFLIGQLPAVLRKDIHTSWIHKGNNGWGGGNNNILIHTGAPFERDGIEEETLIHEAANTSLDSYHANNNDWLDAQRKDNHFISDYAEENPTRQDIAESFLAYIAVTHRSDRISSELKSTILKTIPNRIKYFDNQNFDLSIYSK